MPGVPRRRIILLVIHEKVGGEHFVALAGEVRLCRLLPREAKRSEALHCRFVILRKRADRLRHLIDGSVRPATDAQAAEGLEHPRVEELADLIDAEL